MIIKSAFIHAAISILCLVTGAIPTAASELPAPWESGDIGNPGRPGNVIVNGESFRVEGSGSDIANTSDQFHMAYRPMNGDGALIARVTGMENTDSWAKAGVMIRESLAAGSRYAMMGITPRNGTSFQYRSETSGITRYRTLADGRSPPCWVGVLRSGDMVRGYVSDNGSDWILVGSTIVGMGQDIHVGLVVTSRNNALVCGAEFDGIGYIDNLDGIVGNVPAPWESRDIGSPALAGSAFHKEGSFFIEGGGADIWSTADEFHMVDRPLNGNVVMIARVVSMGNSDSWAKAGIMIRESHAPNSRHVTMAVRPEGGQIFQYRSDNGGITKDRRTAPEDRVSPPCWVGIIREGDNFSGYTSKDGIRWYQTGSAVVSMPANVRMGLATCAHKSWRLCGATFDNVRSAPDVAGIIGNLPGLWKTADIGNTGQPGATVNNDGVFTVQGGGLNIWDSDDETHMAGRLLAGDGEITARIAGFTDSCRWMMAGVAIRESLASGSRRVMLVVNPGSGVKLLYRSEPGVIGKNIWYSYVPSWLRLVRTGNTFTGFFSDDGNSWIQAGSVTIQMEPSVQIGLTVTSEDYYVLCGADFDSVEIKGGIPAPVAELTADSLTLLHGDSTTLRWNTTSAATCTLEPGAGSVAPNGLLGVSPTETTTYTLVASGPAGTTGVEITITVDGEPPTPPEDLDHGFFEDEQEGGGGLIDGSTRILNGNMLQERTDIHLTSPHRNGLNFEAFYNSRSPSDNSLGFGWTHTYSPFCDPGYIIEERVFVRIIDETGRSIYFREKADGIYEPVFNGRTALVKEEEKLVWHRPDGSRYGFSASGKLAWIEDTAGNGLSLSYGSGGELEKVTDLSADRVLSFNYNEQGKILSISGPVVPELPSGIWASYDYDDKGNLISTTGPCGKGFDYSYNDPEDPHNITKKSNKEAPLVVIWEYDTVDRVISRTSSGKEESFLYLGENMVDVSDSAGVLRSYELHNAGGRKRVVKLSGPPDASNGDEDVTGWSYDPAGNLIEAEYRDGSRTLYLNPDTRGNPGKIIHGAGTTSEQENAFTWHPAVNTPLSISESGIPGESDRTTIYDYDIFDDGLPNGEPGKIVQRTIKSGFTSDAAGQTAPYEQITLFTHNEKGQLSSVDGPKEAGLDRIVFSYAPVTGDLTGISHPTMGAATYSDHDAAGRVGTITDGDNAAVSFDRDGAGRIISVKGPDDVAQKYVYIRDGQIELYDDPEKIWKRFEFESEFGLLP